MPKTTYTPRLKETYGKKLVPGLMEEFGLKYVMQVPRLQKIVLNMGVGEAVTDRKFIQHAQDDLTQIAGQRAVVTRARASIAAFKVRQGMPIGVKVTLRRERMYEFLDRLITIALPRQRDFRGISPKSFDGHGNFSLGVKEQIVFPEIDYDKVLKIRGLQVVICISGGRDDMSRSLLKGFGIPFRE